MVSAQRPTAETGVSWLWTLQQNLQSAVSARNFDVALNVSPYLKSATVIPWITTCTLTHTHQGLHSDEWPSDCGCKVKTSSIGWSNGLLNGAPASTVDWLQRVQNNLGSSLQKKKLHRRLSKQINSLMINRRISHKLAFPVYKVIRMTTPQYLDSPLQCHHPT